MLHCECIVCIRMVKKGMYGWYGEKRKENKPLRRWSVIYLMALNLKVISYRDSTKRRGAAMTISRDVLISKFLKVLKFGYST